MRMNLMTRIPPRTGLSFLDPSLRPCKSCGFDFIFLFFLSSYYFSSLWGLLRRYRYLSSENERTSIAVFISQIKSAFYE